MNARRQVLPDMDVFRLGGADQPQNFTHDIGEVQSFKGNFILVGEGRQLGHHIFGPQ